MHQSTSEDRQLLELFPGIKIVPNLAIAALYGSQGRNMCPPNLEAEAYSVTEDTHKAEEPSLPLQQKGGIEPKKKAKGRSGGENSSRSIKALRKQAGKGDLEVAMKLGWSVARITDIFNENKRARGEQVSPGQPIDDDEILARIAVRQKSQAETQKRRQDTLRKKAYEGDYEAAKKLKMGKRRMREIFPQMFNFGNSEEGEKDTKTQVAEEPRMPTQAYREGTPAEPRNFEFERHMAWLAGLPAPDDYMPCDVMGSGGYHGHNITGDAAATRPANLKASPPSTQVSLTPPSYPIPSLPGPSFGLQEAHKDEDSMQFPTAGHG